MKNRKMNEFNTKFIPNEKGMKYISALCFEIGSSLSILDNPGEAGLLIDSYATQINSILDKVYNTTLGETRIKLGHLPSNTMLLKDFFNQKILSELHPQSDQLGRCLDNSLKNNWFELQGRLWLRTQLLLSSNQKNYCYSNMLTKIRVIIAFGTITRLLIKNNQTKLLSQLYGCSINTINKRYSQFIQKVRHEKFDSQVTRARREKMPIVYGKILQAYPKIDFTLTPAETKNLGFGEIYHIDFMQIKKSFINQSHWSTINKYLQQEQKLGRQGMPRFAQEILDLYRPGLLSENSIQFIPKKFKQLGLMQQLSSHRIYHGSGLNRWLIYGTFAYDASLHNMPVASAHSGVTANAFLTINYLEKESIFGNKAISQQVGLMLAAFLNFGGYHSFVETFPIAQSIANNIKYQVQVTQEHKNNLYQEMVSVIQDYDKKTAKGIEKYLSAYEKNQHYFFITKSKNINSLTFNCNKK